MNILIQLICRNRYISVYNAIKNIILIDITSFWMSIQNAKNEINLTANNTIIIMWVICTSHLILHRFITVSNQISKYIQFMVNNKLKQLSFSHAIKI